MYTNFIYHLCINRLLESIKIMTESLEIQTKFGQVFYLIGQGKADDTLKILKDLKSKYPENINVIGIEHVVLIEAGKVFKDEVMINEGINKGKKLLEDKVYVKSRAEVHYNVANGYMNLFEINPHESISSRIGNDNLQNVKRHLRQALKSDPKEDLKVNVLTHYGNCLDYLGRSLEALYCYEDALQIDPNHSMAIGNRALAKLYFADISGAYREKTYIEAYQELKSIIDKKDLLAIGGISANKSFKEKLLKIESKFKDKSILEQNLSCNMNERRANTTCFEKEYLDFCSEHRLFLNFHTGDCNCRNTILDSAFISIITPIDDDTRFYSLAKKINDIKEDFLISKLLLAQSQFKRDDLDSISQKVILVDTSDYANFNIYSALLKSSFRTCYNILDKIAFFIKDYLNLEIKESQIYFSTIWKNPNTKEIKKEIKETDNISLFALYDIHLDLDQDRRLKNLRNSITHRKLTIYDSVLTDWDGKEDPENIGYNSMLLETINLMRIVKSAIIYLMNFIEIEENKKRDKLNGQVVDIFVDTSQSL